MTGPAWRGDGTSHVSLQEGVAYVRLYGDPNQVVMAENRTLKPLRDRPCFVREGRSLHLYEVVAPRHTTGDETETYADRAYQYDLVVLCVGGLLKVGSADFPRQVATPLTPFGLSGDVRTAPTGADIVFSLTRNGAPVAACTIPAGDITGSTTLETPLALDPDDVLDLDITQVGSETPGSALVGTAICRQYGIQKPGVYPVVT